MVKRSGDPSRYIIGAMEEVAQIRKSNFRLIRIGSRFQVQFMGLLPLIDIAETFQ